MIRRALVSLACYGLSLALAEQAFAQETTLIEPSIPIGFDRGRNVSVDEKPRPDYDAIGINIGSFQAFPRLDLGVGFSDNLYLTQNNTTSAAFAAIAPDLQVQSNWDRHEFRLHGGVQLERYFGESRRNQTAFDVGSLGRLDFGSADSLTFEAQLARRYETPFTGAVASDVAVLSNYLRNFESIRGVHAAGQTRLTLAVDHTGFDFAPVEFASGVVRSQSDRDRVVNRVVGQGEYAFTPSFAVYGQVGFGRTDYGEPLSTGQPNRDSDGVRVIAGTSFDLAALLRGTVGVGYTWRNYDSPLYRDVSGVSAEARIEWFPTELTTVTFRLSRVIEDSSIGNNSAYFNNLVTARVDHEILNNLIANATAEYSHQDYVDSTLSADTYRFGVGARYLVSRTVTLRANVSYAGRRVDSGNTALGGDFNETRGLLTVALHR